MTLIMAGKGIDTVVVFSDYLCRNPNTKEMRNGGDKTQQVPGYHVLVGMAGLLDTESEISVIKNYMDNHSNPLRAMRKYLREDNPIIRNMVSQNAGLYNDDVNTTISQLVVSLGKDGQPMININQEVIPNFKEKPFGGIGHAYPHVEKYLKENYLKNMGTQALINLFDEAYKIALSSPIGKEISKDYSFKIMSRDTII